MGELIGRQDASPPALELGGAWAQGFLGGVGAKLGEGTQISGELGHMTHTRPRKHKKSRVLGLALSLLWKRHVPTVSTNLAARTS